MVVKMMKAVVFKGPFEVAVENHPVPSILDPTDAIVRVSYSGLCGSDLHLFRALEELRIVQGIELVEPGFVMGHEFTGIIEEVGSAVTSFHKGDKVVSPFTTTCGSCFYCVNDYSSRCVESKLFGSKSLNGGQAQLVRVPLADSTLMKAPAGIKDEALILMADIFPTGFFAARNGLKDMCRNQIAEAIVIVIGCGPVGLCTIANVNKYRPKNLLAVDCIGSRLDLAKSLGAESWNYQTQRTELDRRLESLTDGRGADVVIEVVGSKPALRMGFELLRPWGFLSSVGVHNAEIPWSGSEAYNKNLKVQMGRCPVKSVMQEALAALMEIQDELRSLLEYVIPLTDAVEGYDRFDRMEVQKGEGSGEVAVNIVSWGADQKQ